MTGQTYHDYEISYEDGSPVELYEFAYGGGVWAFCTDTTDVEFNATIYRSAPIKRGEVEDTGDTTKSNIEIRVARNTSLGDVFKVTPPSESITVTVKQYHAELGFVAPELMVATVWKGRVTNVAWEGDELVLVCESVFSSLMRIGVTRKFSRACSHALYSDNCGVNRQDFSATAVCAGIVGTVLSVATNKPANWFANGYIEYRNATTNVLERRMIAASTENTITLVNPPIGIQEGVTEVTVFAGCDHKHTTCQSKFNNVLNYGGQPFIPIKNPFNQSNVY